MRIDRIAIKYSQAYEKKCMNAIQRFQSVGTCHGLLTLVKASALVLLLYIREQ